MCVVDTLNCGAMTAMLPCPAPTSPCTCCENCFCDINLAVDSRNIKPAKYKRFTVLDYLRINKYNYNNCCVIRGSERFYFIVFFWFCSPEGAVSSTSPSLVCAHVHVLYVGSCLAVLHVYCTCIYLRDSLTY